MSPVPPERRGPPGAVGPSYSIAPTQSDEGDRPLAFGDGFPDPSSTGNTGGVPSKDSTRLFAMYGQIRSDLTVHGWGLVALAVAVGAIGGVEVLYVGAQIGWWLAGR